MHKITVIHPKKTALYAVTAEGAALATRLSLALGQSEILGQGEVLAWGCLGRGSFKQKRQVTTHVLQKFANLNTEVQLEVFSRLGPLLAQKFSEFDEHIFIAASGLVVRALAPHLKSKAVDPAVVVVDQKGQHAISLLSGHMGGANALAREVAKILGGQAVVTTATDVEKLPAPDEFFARLGFKVVNPRAVKWVNAELLATGKLNIFEKCEAGGPRFLPCLANDALFQQHYNDLSLPCAVNLPSEANLASAVNLPSAVNLKVGASPKGRAFLHEPSRLCAKLPCSNLPAGPLVLVSFKKEPVYLKKLVLAPPALHVGIGCRRGTSADQIIAFVEQVFKEQGWEIKALASLASIEQKQDEAGLLLAGRFFKVPCVFFSAEALRARPGPSVSAKAKAVFGVEGVCEPAALLAGELGLYLAAQNSAGKQFESNAAKAAALLLPKQTTQNITLAVATPASFCCNRL